MNLTLSSKIRQINPRYFFTDREKLPCWYVEAVPSDKRRQFKWKVGVKFRGETEEYTQGVTVFDTSNDEVWTYVTSQSFALKLLNLFKSGGKKAIKDWLKE